MIVRRLLEVELHQDLPDVRLHGLQVEAQSVPDPLIGASLGDEGEHLALALRQLVERVVLAGSPDEPPDDRSANGAAEFELTLDRGKLVQTYLGAGTPDSGSGTYTVDGDHVEFVFTEGSGAGEDFQLLWSLFDDTLTFERDPAGESPTPYVVKPWTKSS